MSADAVTHPFDTPGTFVVLENDRAQRCLWPVFAVVPPGWSVAYGPAERDDALAWIEEHDTGLLAR